MHEEAEYGLAAHWAYSEAKGKGESDTSLEEKGVLTVKEKIDWGKPVGGLAKRNQRFKRIFGSGKI